MHNVKAESVDIEDAAGPKVLWFMAPRFSGLGWRAEGSLRLELLKKPWVMGPPALALEFWARGPPCRCGVEGPDPVARKHPPRGFPNCLKARHKPFYHVTV